MQTPKLILRDIPNLNKIEVYLENGGFDSFRKAIATTPDDVIGSKKIRPSRTLRCMFSDRFEMVVYAERRRNYPLSRL